MSTHTAYIELLSYNRLGLRDETLGAARKILAGTPRNVWEFREALSAVKSLVGDSVEWRKLARATFRRMKPLHQDVTRNDLQRFLSTKRPKPLSFTPPRGPRLTFATCPDEFKAVFMFIQMEEHLHRGNRKKAAALARMVRSRLRAVRDKSDRNFLHDILAMYYAGHGRFEKAEKHWRAMSPDASTVGTTRFENIARLRIAEALRSAKEERDLVQSYLRQASVKSIRRDVSEDLEIAATTTEFYVRQLKTLLSKNNRISFAVD